MVETTTGTTPILCTGSGCNDATLATLLNNNSTNGQWNNPFIYLVWLMFAQRFGFGSNESGTAATTAQNAEIMSKLNDLGSQLSSNQNTNLMMDAINDNHEALHQLQTSLGVDYATLSGAIAGVQNAITQVSGAVGMTGQQVINSVLLGNKDLTAAMQSCCCENKVLQMQNFSANQLQQSQIAAATQASIESVRQAAVNGFANIGYEGSQNTNAIIQAGNSNTQRILDQLNNHWTAELSQELQNAKFEQSQLKQNVYLGGLINGTSTNSIW